MSLNPLYLIIVLVNLKIMNPAVLHSNVDNGNNLVKRDTVTNYVPTIQEYRVQVNVANRFAKTTISNIFENAEEYTNFITFSAVIPEGAYVGEFQMEMEGKVYKPVVLERFVTDKIYRQPHGNKKIISYLKVSTRNAKRFVIHVNALPKTKVYFYLVYVELLERKNGQYEITVNIHPGQFVDNLGVNVNITESKSLKYVRVPNLKSGNEAVIQNNGLNPKANIIKHTSTALVTFEPNVKEQAEYACAGLGSRIYEGFAGQFVVQYEIERDFNGCEKIEQNGFFVIFCAPDKLDPLPKHVVFALDTSYSMLFDNHLRIGQLKDAMLKILPQLNPEDLFNILEYNTAVHVWDLDLKMYNISTFSQNQLNSLPDAKHASRENIAKAKKIIAKLRPRGTTNIMGGLEVALNIIKRTQEKFMSGYQPILMFLTDADNSGFNNSNDIISKISYINKQQYNAPIYSISFGRDADWKFLRTLSLMNQGKATRVEIAKDTSIQLQDLYRKISAPLLRNISFHGVVSGDKITQNNFPLYFNGSELVVAVKEYSPINESHIRILAKSKLGSIELATQKETPLTQIDEVWAYLTIRQIMDQIYAGGNRSALQKMASNIAINYSLLTDVTSFSLDTEDGNVMLETEDSLKGVVQIISTLPMCKNVTAWFLEKYPAPEPMEELDVPYEIYSQPKISTPFKEKNITCIESEYGCCYDNQSFALGPNFSGCDPIPNTDICFLPFNTAKCSNVTVKTTKWYYNQARGTCERFLYEGCKNQGNRFKNRVSCENSCIHASGKHRCKMPILVKQCKDNGFQWYFDRSKDECVQIQEGCLEHTNRFSKRNDCLQLCKPDKFDETQKGRCYLPKDGGRGDCMDYELNYYHDAITGLCQEFLYDGCGGNSNRFRSLEECQRVCLNER